MKSDKMQKAQVSLEYLIVLAALISVILVFMPLIIETQKAGIFALDIIKAESFSKSFADSISEMQFLGEGTKKVFEVEPLGIWEIECNNGILTLKVKSREIKNEKVITQAFSSPSNKLKCSFSVENRAYLTIEKNHSGISVKNN